MSDHDCGDPNCKGLHGSLAELIGAYERKDPPFKDDTPAQNVLRGTFPVPVVVACGALISVKLLAFIEAISSADTAKDAAELLNDFLQSMEIEQLSDFAQTMLLLHHAWEECRITQDGDFEIPVPDDITDIVVGNENLDESLDEMFIEDFKRRMN